MEESKIVNIDDKKLLLGLFFVVVLGSLVSGNFTGNAGRTDIVTKFNENEFHLSEGAVKLYNGNVIKLERVGADGVIIVRVITESVDNKRKIEPGHEIYVNGYFITNIAANYKGKSAVIGIK